MKIATALSSASFGSLGTFTVWDDAGNKELIPLPDTVNTLSKYTDFPSWRRGDFSRTYVLGGHTDNLVFTEHKWLLRIGINAPSAPIVTPGPPIENQVGVVAAAGGGLSGQASVALRFLDSLHFRRSPLGAASPAFTLAGQGATFTNVPGAPVPGDPCVDKIEIYVSIDGGLFRHWATRDIGAPTFTVNETTTGEAYSEELTMYPKLAFGDMNMDRMFSAGDPRHPERLYVSQVGNPEEYTGLFLSTKNGEPIIGIKNIGGSTIYVQCPNSCYYVQGFNEGDLIMKILKPQIGGFGQSTIALVDDVGMIPTQRGWFRCDGTSMVPIGDGEWVDTWRKSARLRRSSYSNGFSATDYVSGVVRFFPQDGFSPEIIGYPAGLNNNYWVFSIAGLVPEIGGSGQADLSFDSYATNGPTCAAMLYDPDSEIGAFYTGDVFGDIVVENQTSNLTETTRTFIVHTAHPALGPVASDDDAFTITDAFIDFLCERHNVTMGVYAGNDFAWQAGELNVPFGFKAPEEFAVPAGVAIPADPSIDNPYVPRDIWLQPNLAKSAGSSVSLRLTAMIGPDTLVPSHNQIEQRAPVVFYGWGVVANTGTDNRPLGSYQGGA